jgi:hypothetical protein
VSNLRQQDVPAEDLSDLSSPQPRGAGLAGLIGTTASSARPQRVEPPRPQRIEPVRTERVGTNRVSPPETVQQDVSPRTREVDETSVRRRGKPGRPRTRVKPTTAVYVSPNVKKRFDKYRHAQKATNLQVVLEAISNKHDELAGIIEKSRFHIAPVNPLFPADPSAVRYVGGGSVQIGFSPTPEQEEVIDQIGQRHGFTARSTWIAPVLNAFLPGRKDTH